MAPRSGSALPLGLTEEMRTAVLENLSDGVYFVDRRRRILYWNNGAERITGFAKDEVLGHRCHDNLLNHCDDAGTILCKTRCPLAATMRDGELREAHVYLKHKDGHRKPVRVRAAPVRDADGTVVGAVETFHDDTALFDARQREQELERESMIDPLTGVGNRRLGKSTLAGLVKQFDAAGRSLRAAIRRYRPVQAGQRPFGHDIGDVALRAVARTLAETCRTSDTVARWGGDEFLVLLAEARPRTLELIAERVRALVERSEIATEQGPVPLTVSVGATVVKRGDTPNLIVRRADALLYASKAAGRNRVTLDPFSRV